MEEPTDDRYNLCKYKIYNGGNINENLIYYDKFGNISYINNNKLEYGYNNLLSKYIYDGNNTSNEFNIIDYKYDGLSKRVSKRVQKNNGNYLIEYKYDGNKLICENRYSYTNSNVDNKELTYSFVYTYDYDGLSGIIVYDYLNSRYQSSRYVQDGIYYNYVKDALGNIIGLVRDSKLVCKYSYDAWGNYTLNEYLDERSNYKNLDQFVIDNNPFRYKGYYYDVETSLFWLSSRYYSPELCRFISPDDVGYIDPTSINGLNLYCYCYNNPIMYVDPSGHEAIAAGLITMAYYALIALLAIFAISTVAYIESETHFIENSLTSLGNAITDLFTSEIAYSGNTITDSQEVITPSNLTLAYNLDNVYYYKRKKAAPRIRSNSKKRAREKAFLKGGKVTPIHHPNGKYGPHFHPRDPRFSHWHYYYLWLLLFREYDE